MFKAIWLPSGRVTVMKAISGNSLGSETYQADSITATSLGRVQGGERSFADVRVNGRLRRFRPSAYDRIVGIVPKRPSLWSWDGY